MTLLRVVKNLIIQELRETKENGTLPVILENTMIKDPCNREPLSQETQREGNPTFTPREPNDIRT